MGSAGRVGGAPIRLGYRLVTVTALCVLAVARSPHAQTPPQIRVFRIEHASASIQCPGTSGLYYAMLLGDTVSVITSAVCVALQDTNGFASLQHDLGEGCDPTCAFYALLGLPLTAPADMDLDGMDDLFELGHDFLDPLNVGDAWADEDADGVCNLVEYRQGRNLTAGAIPGTASDVALVVHAPPAW